SRASRPLTEPRGWGPQGTSCAPPFLDDIARSQVLEALAPDHHTRIAVSAEDHRRAWNAVVVARHRMAVGAGGGGHDHIARPGILERGLAHDHIAGLAVLSREHAARGAAEAIGDLRLVDRAVEHRAQVVRHAAVDGHPARDVLLDALDRVEGHGGI